MKQFYKEIQKQPQALQDTLEYYIKSKEGKKKLQEARDFFEKNLIDHIVFSGMGSSFFNSYISYYYLSQHKISCEIKDTREMLNYYEIPTRAQRMKTLFIFVSQSGESGEIIRILEKWEKVMGEMNIWAITNTTESTLAKKADLVFFTKGGKEKSVTSKTYITGILVHYLISQALSGKLSVSEIIKSNIDLLKITLEKLMNGKIPNRWELYQRGEKIFQFMGDRDFLNFIGTGTSMATVHQAALNFKEVCKTPAEGISLGMFRHGPIETINKKFRAIILISDKKAAQEFKPLIENITNIWGEGKVVIITTHPKIQNLKNMKKGNNVYLIENPIKNPFLAPIFEISVLQLYMCYQAERKGFTPGVFINSSKITK